MSQSFIKKPEQGPHSALGGLGVLSAERSDHQEREAFEKWAKPRLFSLRRIKASPEQYLDLSTECAWQARGAAGVLAGRTNG